MSTPWKIVDKDMEIFRHEDALGALGFYEFLKKEGINDDDVIPAEHRQRFYQVVHGERVPFLVVSNNLGKTVAPEVVKGFDNIFQEGIKLTGSMQPPKTPTRSWKESLNKTSTSLDRTSWKDSSSRLHLVSRSPAKAAPTKHQASGYFCYGERRNGHPQGGHGQLR